MRRFLEKLLAKLARHLRALLLAPVDLGVAALVERDGKVVLVRHSYKSGLMLPGGAVDRGEHPTAAILREMREEIGLTESAAPELIGVFTRPTFWVSNVVLLYRLRQAQFAFTPSWEIRELVLVDPADLPPGVTSATRRRLAESGGASPTLHW